MLTTRCKLDSILTSFSLLVCRVCRIRQNNRAQRRTYTDRKNSIVILVQMESQKSNDNNFKFDLTPQKGPSWVVKVPCTVEIFQNTVECLLTDFYGSLDLIGFKGKVD